MIKDVRQLKPILYFFLAVKLLYSSRCPAVKTE